MEEQNNDQSESQNKGTNERMWVSFPVGGLTLIFINSLSSKVYDFFGIVMNPNEGFFDKFQHFEIEKILVSLLVLIMPIVGMIASYFIVEVLLILFTDSPTYRKYGGFVLVIIFGLSAAQLWFTVNHGGDDIFSWKGFSAHYRMELVCMLCLSIMFGSARLFFSENTGENSNQ